MATVTVMKCDHCGADTSRGSVGPDNVNTLEVAVRGGQRAVNKEVDLCVDCQEELHRAIERWTTAAVRAERG